MKTERQRDVYKRQLCDSCYQQLGHNQEQIQQESAGKPENVLAGVVGALLGCCLLYTSDGSSARDSWYTFLILGLSPSIYSSTDVG